LPLDKNVLFLQNGHEGNVLITMYYIIEVTEQLKEDGESKLDRVCGSFIWIVYNRPEKLLMMLNSKLNEMK
jgi:hypothetical protein